MSRVEELPDDFDESLDLNKSPSTSATAAPPPPETPFGIKPSKPSHDPTTSTAPALPPSMASVRSHTAEEILSLMNQTPLFMTDIEQAQADSGGEENVFLEAIRALQHEGTQAEVAEGFRETGNELAREKKWSDAREFYGKALATLKANGEEGKWDASKDVEEDAKKMRETEEKVLVNRALCNLELKNYRSCILDCAGALKLNPQNVKAYYRSACALLALDKITEAHDAAKHGLALDSTNRSLHLVSEKIVSRKATLEALNDKRRAEKQLADRKKSILSKALFDRRIKLRQTSQAPDLDDAVMHLSDPLSSQSTLIIPCVLLYPMHAQSDFIKQFEEAQSLRDHLEYILPLPWDTEEEYKIATVDCFMETISGGLIRFKQEMSLLAVLESGKVEIVDGLVKINVVPKDKSQKWIEEVKARRGSG